MGHVFDEFERELATLATKHSGAPRKEMLQLCLLALEREELVSVSYRESLMVQRLGMMPLDDSVREVIRHALVWIWKDEEMHSIYIRGAILRLGSLRLRVLAFLRQFAGGLGGWASSVLQHARWRHAPFSRAVAHAVVATGKLLGRVPKTVRKHLEFGPFRNFCLYNIDAEKTAWRCWSRLAELAEGQRHLGENLLFEFRRVMDDEDRHAKVFAVLAEALDDGDRLVPGESAATLVEKIREVGEFFLPRSQRRTSDLENPLGSGGTVWCYRARGADDKLFLLRRLLGDSGLRQRMEERARFLGKPLGGLRVAIKPTFMLGYNRRDPSPITDPVLLDELASYLNESGCSDVVVLEGENIYDKFYGNRSVLDVAEYLGVRSPHFRVVDASREQVPHKYGRGMAQYTISRSWQEADFRISFAKLRSHPIELAHLTVGNVEWLGARCDEFLFIERQANRTTAVLMLLDEFPPHFALIDGYDAAPDGLVGVMGCRRPRSPRRLYAGRDALAVDAVAFRHLGIREPRESSLLRAACHWFGSQPRGIEVLGSDEPVADWRGPYDNELWAILSIAAFPIYVMGSGRGSLFVPEMDENAFPPLRPEGFFLRRGRRAVRRLLGLRLPSPSPAASLSDSRETR
jgi:uncharacterized protein (DUF362 family)